MSGDDPFDLVTAPRLDDRPDVAALLAATTAHRGGPALSEHKRLDLRAGTTHLGLVGTPLGADGVPPAYAHLSRHGDDGDGHPGWGLEVVVGPGADPAWRLRALDAAVRTVAERGGGRVHWWVASPGSADDADADAAGFTPDRDLLQLRRPLPHPDPVVAPPGARIRPFEPGRDDAAWLAVNAAAFATHPEQGALGQADLDARTAEPWFDAAAFLLAVPDPDPAPGDLPILGFCWTKQHPPDPDDRAGGPLGEIYAIGVHPSQGGRGLGRWLVLAGLDHQSRSGAGTGMLYVDGDNVTAVALYDRLGFHRHAHDRAYLRHVAP